MSEIPGMTQTFTPPEDSKEFAKLLLSKVDISAGYASELANGIKTPSLKKAIEFEKAYGIPPSFWEAREQ